MSIKLGRLLAGVKRAVVEAQRSVAEQHMEEPAQYFVPASGQKAELQFPDGQWEARSVTMQVPHKASRNGKVSIERRAVHGKAPAPTPATSAATRDNRTAPARWRWRARSGSRLV